METYCREIIENNPYVTGCAIAFTPYYYKDQELFMTYVHQKVSAEDGSILITANKFGNRPYTQQEWYTAPLKTGHACWTDPLAEEEDEGVTLSLCLPIYAKHAKAEARSKQVPDCLTMLMTCSTSRSSRLTTSPKDSVSVCHSASVMP